LISVAVSQAQQVMASLQKAGIQAVFVGSVTARTGKNLKIG
jgi:phosphoribosylaminoimidazole (AIR) synthetase